MNKIFFDYKIDLFVIAQDNQIDYKEYELYQLKGICNGRIYIFFDYDKKKRNFMLLETGILDYILQFDNLFSYLDAGNYETFTVSGDYYSNNLSYIYSKENDTLEIHDVNSDLYYITCKYKDFKKAYEKFRKKTLLELITFYPEFKNNKYFIEYFRFD